MIKRIIYCGLTVLMLAFLAACSVSKIEGFFYLKPTYTYHEGFGTPVPSTDTNFRIGYLDPESAAYSSGSNPVSQAKKYKINHLRYYLIYNFSNFIRNRKINSSKKAVNRINRISKVINFALHLNYTKLTKVDSGMAGFSNQFINYMPSSTGTYHTPSFYVVDLLQYNYYNRYAIFATNQKVINYLKPFQFEIESKQFPQNFVYPPDYFNYVKRVPLDQGSYHIVHYLFLSLPRYTWINCFGTDKYAREHKGRVSQRYKGHFKGYLFTGYKLLLNPAYKVSYHQSIKFIWNLYLVKVKYEDLNDTLTCNSRSHYNYDLCSLDVQTYLQNAIQNQPEMYKSYFELIFWQMYQPKDFEIKDNRGEERSFTFTSTSKRFPGKYVLQFNIYRPYEFKVKRR